MQYSSSKVILNTCCSKFLSFYSGGIGIAKTIQLKAVIKHLHCIMVLNKMEPDWQKSLAAYILEAEEEAYLNYL